jgi:hypothetical protein
MDARNARCSRSSNSLSSRHAPSVALPFSGRGKKLLPFSANNPLCPPSIRLRTAYFQYAACTVSSHILCRPAPGRQAASLALTPRIACLRLGPCQAFFSYASSSNLNTSSWVFTVSTPSAKASFAAIFRLARSLFSHAISLRYSPLGSYAASISLAFLLSGSSLCGLSSFFSAERSHILHNFSANKLFRLKICKSVSKQMALTIFTLNTYEKTRGFAIHA